MSQHGSLTLTLRQALTCVVAVMAIVVATTAPAYAATRSWNSKAKPLTAYQDGKAMAQGYGTWKIGTTSNGTRSQAYGHLRDRAPRNKRNVYFELFTWVNAGYCLQPEYTSCNQKFFYWRKQFSNSNKETWNQNTWSPTFYASTSVSPRGNYARAQMQVSESKRGPDLKSGFTYTKGNKY